MKVVQLVTQREAGGAQRVALLLAEELSRRGYRSEVLFLYRKRPAFDDEPLCRDLAPRRPGPLGGFRLALRLVRDLRSSRPDAIVLHTQFSIVIGAIGAVLAGVPTRVAVHHLPLSEYHPVLRWCDCLFGSIGAYQSVVSVSACVDESLRHHPRPYRRRATVIPNAIPPPREPPTREDARTRMAIDEEDVVVASVGRLAPQKDLSTVLRALPTVPRALLVVAGEGPLRESLVRTAHTLRVGDRVRFLGEVEHDVVDTLFAAADVFVLASRFEAMPLALMEAMAAGLPIIATDIPANRELLHENARFFPPGDDRELARHLTDIADAPPGMAKLASDRHHDALLDVGSFVDSYEAVLRPNPGGEITSVELLGLRIDALPTEALTEVVERAVERRERLVVANHNLHSLYLAQRDPALAAFFRTADVVHADGMAVVYAARLLRRPLRRCHRTTYVDWLPDLLATANRHGWRIFVVGGLPGVAEEAVRRLSDIHPRVTFGTHHGYFDHAPGSRASRAVVDAINRFAPDIVMVGMGMPRQERWLSEHLDDLAGSAFLLSGGAMDYVAGSTPTPPRWMGRVGLEWLARLAAEPGRLWHRYLVEPLLLIALVLRRRLRRRLEGAHAAGGARHR